MTYTSIYRYVMQFSSNRSLDRPAENVNPGFELRHCMTLAEPGGEILYSPRYDTIKIVDSIYVKFV